MISARPLKFWIPWKRVSVSVVPLPQGDDDCRYDGDRVRLFLLVSKFICPEFIFDDFVVVWRFEVGKFRSFAPAGILVASAVRAEGGIFLEWGVAMGAIVHRS